MEKPRTSKFLDELRSINCKLANPVAAIIPNRTQKMPPMMGSGIVMKRAPNLDKTTNTIIINAATWITLLLPTYSKLSLIHSFCHLISFSFYFSDSNGSNVF